jgi:hypothetical protein
MFAECDQSYLKKDYKAKIIHKNNGKIEILFQFFLGKPTIDKISLALANF